MEEGEDLQTRRTFSINIAEVAEVGGESALPPAASRRRGHAQAQRQHGPILSAGINQLTFHNGVGGGDSDSEFTGNGVPGAAQARHVDGAAHAAIDVAALQAADHMRQPTELVANREFPVLSPSSGSINGGGATGCVATVGCADTMGDAKASKSADKYAKILLALFGVALSACTATYPVIKQAAPDGYTTLAYGMSVVLALILLAGLLATSFDHSPSSVVCGKYALQLALGLTIGLLTWSICTLDPEHKLDVPIGIAGALVYVVLVVLFRCRKW